MRAFEEIAALVAPLNRPTVDTDAIIPKQFLKSIRTGFGVNLFDQWRHADPGLPGQDCTGHPRNPQFVLNDPRYAGAQTLLARENFGCFKNGLLLVVLAAADVDRLFARLDSTPGYLLRTILSARV